MILHCCGCSLIVVPRLTNGAEIYPHREDLSELNFWVCDDCGNYVGCHKDVNDTPLGSIPSPEIRECRRKLHSIIDPLWRRGLINRSDLYNALTSKLGYEYHTGQVNTVRDYVEVKEIISDIAMDLDFNMVEYIEQLDDVA